MKSTKLLTVDATLPHSMPMPKPRYEEIIKTSLQRFRDLHQQREEIDAELTKLRQLMTAAISMVKDDKEREKWDVEVTATFNKTIISSASLADSVRRVFEDHPNLGFTASTIRGMLEQAGFDFSSYTSNPLSSISTTVRRMVEMGELKTLVTEDGPLVYFKADRPKRRIKVTEVYH